MFYEIVFYPFLEYLFNIQATKVSVSGNERGSASGNERGSASSPTSGRERISSPSPEKSFEASQITNFQHKILTVFIK